jgi:hypothetical protein
MQRIIRLHPFVIILCLLVGFTACKKKEKEKPEMATESEIEEAAETTEEFFEALEDYDFEKAKKYVTPETQPILEVVIEDARKQEQQGKKPEIKVEIVERKPLIGKVNLKVKIMVGPKVKAETLTLIPVEDEWRIVMPRKNLALLRLVVIHHPYEIIVVKEKKKKHHPGKGHAYGHYKHKHDDDDD